jgi:hypothetical protein
MSSPSALAAVSLSREADLDMQQRPVVAIHDRGGGATQTVTIEMIKT